MSWRNNYWDTFNLLLFRTVRQSTRLKAFNMTVDYYVKETRRERQRLEASTITRAKIKRQTLWRNPDTHKRKQAHANPSWLGATVLTFLSALTCSSLGNVFFLINFLCFCYYPPAPVQTSCSRMQRPGNPRGCPLKPVSLNITRTFLVRKKGRLEDGGHAVTPWEHLSLCSRI